VSTLLDDPVLADVPKNATVSDIDTLIGVELGSAMKVSILKLDGTHFGTYPFHSLRAILCWLSSQLQWYLPKPMQDMIRMYSHPSFVWWCHFHHRECFLATKKSLSLLAAKHFKDKDSIAGYFSWFWDVLGLLCFSDVAVLNSAKVGDLKQAVMKYVDSMEQSQLGHRHISWWALETVSRWGGPVLHHKKRNSCS
jgi:hypothetical protein